MISLFIDGEQNYHKDEEGQIKLQQLMQKLISCDDC